MSEHPLGRIAAYVGLFTGLTALLTWVQSGSLDTDGLTRAAGLVLAVAISGWVIRRAARKPTAGSIFWAVAIAAICLVAVVAEFSGSSGVLSELGGMAIIGGILVLVVEQFDRHQREHRTCPYCSEQIKVTATRCKHCHGEVHAAQA